VAVHASLHPGTRRRTGALAALLAALALAVSACGGSAPADGPGAVVSTALDRVAAKDVDGLRALTCAGQEDLIRDQLGLLPSIGSEMLPGLDTQALMDAVQLDVSKVKVGDAVVTGDTATVPVTGDLDVTFDTTVLRPIVKQLLASQGTTMTDAQIDALLSALSAYGQSVPVNESIRLVREGGTWKICQDSVSPTSS